MSSLLESPGSGAQPDDRQWRFGSVAELYDRARPGYPVDLIDAVFEYASLVPGARALDVGSGTGQAAMAFASRGLEVLAVEPSTEMVEVANRKFLAAGLDARATASTFEAATLDPGAFSLISAATSWHWLDPNTRFQIAARALVPGGALAVLWTWPHWRRTALRAELDNAYEQSGAPLAELGPMSPLEPDPGALAREWVSHTRSSGAFGEPQGKLCSWSVTYTAIGYTDLLSTYADHIGLDSRVRTPLLDRVEQTIDRAGGTIELHYSTLLLLARRA